MGAHARPKPTSKLIICVVTTLSVPYSCFCLCSFCFCGKYPTAEFGMVSAETASWDMRKKIAKLLMRTFTCRSTLLYVYWPAAGDLAPVPLAEAGVGGQEGGGHHQQAHHHPRGHLVALQHRENIQGDAWYLLGALCRDPLLM